MPSHHKVNTVAMQNNAVDRVIPGAALSAERPDQPRKVAPMHTVARETEGDEGLAVAVAPLFPVAEVDWKEAQHRLRVQWVVVHCRKIYVAWASLVVTIDLDRLQGAVWALRTACTRHLNEPPAVRLEVGASKHVPNHRPCAGHAHE